MRLLEERIRKDGVIKPGDVLKVDSFLNHRIDARLLNEMGKEFHRLFADAGVEKILTIEASGIAIALPVAQQFDVPLLFAKKTQSINLDGEMLSTKIHSFTHGREYDVIVSKRFLQEGERVLIIDDFLANGCAVLGLIDLVRGAGAVPVGVGVAIEKGYMRGGKLLREQGLRVESLAIIESMDEKTGEIVFREQAE